MHPTLGLRARLSEQPAGIFLLFSTEFWERFSYYGMLGLLVLFMVGPTARGGLGWDNAVALRVFGIFLAMIWFAPMIGGWAADRFIGHRRAVAFGCGSLALGNFLLASCAGIPGIFQSLTGIDLNGVLHMDGVRLAEHWDSVMILGAFPLKSPQYSGLDASSGFVTLSRCFSVVFYSGLVFLVLGAGLFKSNVSVLMGSLFPRPDDRRRDFGFTIFYMGINLGAFVAPLVAGTLGERLGWWCGFGISGVGMLVGLAVFQHFAPRVLVHPAPDLYKSAVTGDVAESLFERRRIATIGIFALFQTIFAVGLMQYGGLLNIFTAQHVDRTIGHFQIPATWFLTLNPLVIFIFGPLIASFWDSRAKAGGAAGSSEKFATGLGFMSIAFALIAYGAERVTMAGPANMSMIVVFYLILTLGELCIYPVGLALVSKLAPLRLVGILMGAWLLSNAVGSLTAGELGVLAQTAGNAMIFGVLAAVAAGAALTVWKASRRLRQLAGMIP